MKTILQIITGLALTALISCQEDSVINNNSQGPEFKYPYSINSFWYYTTRNFVTNLRPDSVGVYFTRDTAIGYGDAKFINDTIINQDTLRILRNNHSSGSHSHSTIELYKQTDTGLIRVAFFSDGANFGPHRPNQNSLRYSLNDKSFSSLGELFFYYRNDFLYDNSIDTVLIFDSPPVTALKYPVKQNTEWFFKNVSNTKFVKKYLNFENISVPSGLHHCIKIQKIWYMDNSPNPEPNLIHYDYFSKEGMVKRDLTVKDIKISNMNGVVIGYIDAKEEAGLNIYTLP